MPLNPLGLYRLKVIGELHGQLTDTSFHFRTHTASTQTTYASELQALVTDFRNNMIPKMQAFAHQEWIAKSILAVTLIPRPGVLIEDTLGGLTGFQVDDCLPSFCSGLLVFRSGVAGRHGHGHIHLPGVAAGLVNASRLESSYLPLLRDIGTTLLQRYGPSGSISIVRTGVFSRVLGVTRNPGPPVTLSYSMSGFFPITSFIARPEVSTMRKRKLFRGQ